MAGQTPVQIAHRAMDVARREGFDVVILDTAGRLSIDQELMDEVRQIRAATNPAETLLVVDAMTGQDAVNTAKAFNDTLSITGIVLTRMDGDARGGAALSMRAITGAPIKLIGIGEKQDALDDFYPERVAGRILGMGDIVGLVERASETIDQAEAEKLAAKMMKGKFGPGGLRQPASPDRQDGQHLRHPRYAAGHGQDEAAARWGGAGHQGVQASGGDHLVDDDQGASSAGHHQGEPQEAHRRWVRHHRAGRQPAAEAVRRHLCNDEENEQVGTEGPDASMGWAP